jgi:hypothetical protein
MQKPFNRTFSNYKKLRLCQHDDYRRYNESNYIENLKEIGADFAEHCLENYKDLILIN